MGELTILFDFDYTPMVPPPIPRVNYDGVWPWGMSRILLVLPRFLPFLPNFGVFRNNKHIVNFAPTKHKLLMLRLFIGLSSFS
jgi:hypothetical protein